MKNSNSSIKNGLTAVMILACGILAGCVESPTTSWGAVSVDVSAYDGTVRKWVEPSPVPPTTGGSKGGLLYLGLLYVEGAEDVALIVGTSEIAEIQSVGLNIDGKLHELSSDSPTEFNVAAASAGGAAASQKHFGTTVDVLKKMVTAERVIIQSRTASGLSEGDFTSHCDQNDFLGFKNPCMAFRDFVAEHIQ